MAFARVRTVLIDILLAAVAVVSLAATLIPDYQRLRSVDFIACDFKTLYVGIALFAAQHDPYMPASYPSIYLRDGVVLPHTWFGRMPVYPPVTFGLLSPLARLPMGTAATAWLVLSTFLAVCALTLMLQFARQQGSGWGARLLLVASFAGIPLFASALDLGNVSAACSSLSISALMLVLLDARPSQPSRTRTLLAAVLLACALCLKPHLAFWVLVSLFLVCGRRGRIAAAGATAFALSASLLSAWHLAQRHALRQTLASLLALLKTEQQSGSSMSATSREVLSVTSQVTPVSALFGLWLRTPWLALATSLCLLLLSGLLLAGLYLHRRGPTIHSALLSTSAICAFGLVFTYHRAHDGFLLILAVLWLCLPGLPFRRAGAKVRASVLGLIAGLVLLSVDLPVEPFHQRQAAFAAALIALSLSTVMIFAVDKKGRHERFLSMPGGQ